MVEINTLLLYILVGAVFGIVYGLRRIYAVERKIDEIDRKIAAVLVKSRSKSKKK